MLSPNCCPWKLYCTMQALLNDIVAMARADSGDSDSSSISQQTHTHTHPPANQDLSPLSHMPTRHDTGQDGPENASSRSQAAEAPTHLAGINSVRHTAAHPAQLAFEDSTDWGVGEADGAMLDGWEGQSAVPRASHFDSWDGQSQAARASPMDGWDDMDPMAMLSQSAQLPSEAQLSKQSDSSSGNVPSSPPAAQGGGMRSTAVSDDGSQAIHSYPVSVHASHTPSSVATLLPLQPSPISRPQPSSTVADHDEGQGTSLDSPHDAAATEAYTGQVSILCQTAPVLTAASCWSDFEQHLGGGCQAMMHSRGGGAPFGPTTVHGFPGIVFEVTQAGHVATVTLFKV